MRQRLDRLEAFAATAVPCDTADTTVPVDTSSTQTRPKDLAAYYHGASRRNEDLILGIKHMGYYNK